MGPESPQKEQGGSTKPDRLRQEDVSEGEGFIQGEGAPGLLL